MATITGFLTDLALAPLAGRFPRLFFRLERPSASGPHVVVTAKVEATINNTTGAFTVDVVSTDELLPAGALYTATADWDAGQELDVLRGLRVPPGSWAISDLILASSMPTAAGIPYGYGPPPPALSRGLYYDVESGEIYGNTSEVL